MIVYNARKLSRLELLYICVEKLVGKIDKVYPPFDLNDYQQYLDSFIENEYIYHSDQSYNKKLQVILQYPFSIERYV